MTIDEMTYQQRIEARAEYKPLIEWLKANTPYAELSCNEILSNDEAWFNDIALSLTLPELLSLYQSGIK